MELETIIYCNSLFSLYLSLAFCYICVKFLFRVAGKLLLAVIYCRMGETLPCKSINAVALLRSSSFADEDDATTSAHNIEDSEKRVIFLNQQQPQKYCNNHISTAKYR